MAAAGGVEAAGVIGDRVRTLFILTAASFALACTSTPDGYVPLADYAPNNVLAVDIDTGAQLSLDPGQGVGVAVQYAAGGTWTIATACDTLKSNYTCAWDLVVSVPLPNPLEPLGNADPRVYRVDPGALRIVVPSQSGADSFSFSAPPGVTLELDVVWDGQHDASMVSWVEGGALKTGAPSNPVDFRPTSPGTDAGPTSDGGLPADAGPG